VTRRERTRQLIELGGLVVKANLVALAGDDRAVLLGAFLAVADRLQSEDHARFADHWRERGREVFAAGQDKTPEP
jgi:hypothetical protein